MLPELVETVRTALELRSLSIQDCENASNAERAWASAPAPEEDFSAAFGARVEATLSPSFAARAGRANTATTVAAAAAVPKKLRGTRAHRVVRRAFIVVPRLRIARSVVIVSITSRRSLGTTLVTYITLLGGTA